MVEDALAALSGGERALVRRWLGLRCRPETEREIADRLQISESAVSRRLAKAFSKVRRKMRAGQ
jgi:DNA-directed RNA polymerase specialized sigma subunit